MERIIQFKLQAMMNPKTYIAMVNDKVMSWCRIGPDNEFVQIHDSTSDNFPNLRRELSLQNESYDFYQQRINDGDHTVWRHGRSGGSEIVSNFGVSDEPYTPLYECV